MSAKPIDVGHYWYHCPRFGSVPATVSRGSRGELVAQWLSNRWPVRADIYGGQWGARIEPQPPSLGMTPDGLIDALELVADALDPDDTKAGGTA